VWTRLRLPARSTTTLVAAQGDMLVYLSDYRSRTRGPVLRSRLWVSPDRGRSWSRRPVPCRPRPTAYPGALTLALGHASALLLDCFDSRESSQALQTRHHIYGSSDSGRHWTLLGDAPPTGDPDAIVDNGAGRAFLTVQSGGADQVDSTLDGGLSWKPAITNRDGFDDWSGLRFLSSQVGFVLGPTHYAPEQLYRTLDGGQVWHPLPLPRPGTDGSSR
jgi:photosystem II stability/assembly factor-like uncharacterized protein